LILASIDQAAVRSRYRRDRRLLLGAAGALIVGSWFYLIEAHTGVGAPAHHAGTPGVPELLLAICMWSIMMVAMMLPVVLPWILLYAGAARDRDAAGEPLGATSAFVAGYLSAWVGFSVVAALLQVGLQRALALHGPDMRIGAIAGGALLLGAGVFQLTPLKQACLKHCRTPIGFFLSEWRPGAAGAYRMGAHHGGYCVACCWALMFLSFALGVMNLAWMAILTLILCIEKLAPGGQLWSRLFGTGFVLWGGWLLAGAF
jgi:predicted metal-binding membrane protein